MKIDLDCFPCMMRQLIEASEMAGADKHMTREIINHYADMIKDIPEDAKAPDVSAELQKYLKKKTGDNDPYYSLKQKNIEMAEKLLPVVNKEIESADDPLKAALLMAAMGNSIDAGVGLNIDIEENIERALEHGFARSDYSLFKERLDKAENLLIIADNSGEAVFDKILIQYLKKYVDKIIYAVRSVPVLNDVTENEAGQIGIDSRAKVVSSGAEGPGLVLETADPDFLEVFEQADLVLSKGQGNLEGLSDVERDIFFLLKAKCRMIAEFLDVELNHFVFVLNH
ncbi:MAG: damage-control phosphatase ARMT1 family protein [Bacillota bacterium]